MQRPQRIAGFYGQSVVMWVLLATMSLFQRHGHDAAMRNVALNVLELDCRMQDVELSPQALVNVAKDPLTRGGWDVLDADVAGESVDL